MSEYKYRVNLFYSYCHKDEHYRNRMETALALLRDEGSLTEWSDRKIIPGTPFSPQIIEKLSGSELVVFLVSPDFLASLACTDEWRRARKNAEETGQKLVPIILRPCAWKDFDIMKDYLALPRDGKAISQWDDEDAAWQDIYVQIKRVLEEIRLAFDVKEEYRKEISKVEFISQNQEDIEISDLFVFPHLLPDRELDFEEIEKKVESLDELMEYEKVLVRGERLNGKTTLCSMFFLHLLSNGQRAMLIDLEEAGNRKNVSKFLEESYTKQLKGDFKRWQQESDLTIVFDNLTSSKIAYIEYALELDNVKRVLVATSADAYFSYFMDEERLADFTQISLLPLKHSQQENLIRNWRRLDPQIRSGQKQLTDSGIDQLERHVNAIMMNRTVPRYPFYVLSILQTHEAFMPQNFEITAYGHCYHALIVAHIMRLNIAKGQDNACLNFLSWFAHAIRRSSSEQNHVSEADFELLLEQYQGKYVIKESTINRLFDEVGPILFRKDKKVGFCWSYSYYFFLGRHLAEHYENNKEMIAEMVDKSYVKHNSLALIFIIHHSNHPETIENILLRTKSSIDGEQPVRLDLEDVKVFQELLRKLPDDIRTNRSVTEERRAERNKLDVLEYEDIEDYEESPNAFLNDIYRALKNMEILSQILKNKHGSLEKERLSEIVETIVDAALRIARLCLLDESKIDDFARFVEERFEGKEDLSNLREGVRCLIFVLIMGCLEKAASLISIDVIGQIVDSLRRHKATPAYDLVYFLYSVNVADPFTLSHRSLLEETLRRNTKNEVLKRVLSWRVQHYFNTHDLEAYETLGKESNTRRVRESIKQSTLDLLKHHMNGSKRGRTSF